MDPLSHQDPPPPIEFPPPAAPGPSPAAAAFASVAPEIKSFVSAAKREDAPAPVPFILDGETFHAVPAALLPAGVLTELAALAVIEDKAARSGIIGTFLDMVLLGESRARFAGRMKNPDNPITMEDITDVVVWMVEDVYGLRPSEPSSASSAG